ncbi:MAG: hypothetical protein GTO03_07860, partial [Planctomycetales bacterium]|nr:hypothetical protein [Planctomycetales bacterium]
TTQAFTKAVKASRGLYKAQNDPPLWWAAVDNKFFACVMAPLDPNTQQEGPAYLTAAQAVDLDGDSQTSDDVTVRLVTSAGRLAAGGKTSFPLACYVGPKDREVFS